MDTKGSPGCTAAALGCDGRGLTVALGRSEDPIAELLLIAFAGLMIFGLAGVAQSVSGFGLALIAVPLLTLLVDPVSAVVAATVTGLVIASSAAWSERAHAERRVAGVMTLSGIVGMPLGLVLLDQFSERALSGLMGAALLMSLILIWRRVQLPTGSASAALAGGLSGALLTSIGMNGPPLVLGLTALQLRPRVFRATLQTIFSAQDLVAAGAFVALGFVDRTVAVLCVAGAVGSLLGWRIGERIFHRLSAEQFRAIVLMGLLATALVVLVSAF